MSFLDEDELAPADGPGSGRYGGDRQRQILIRRLIALGVAIGVVILLLLAVRGCLNARKERGFENYLSDLSSIVDQSNQLSEEFFTRLQSPDENLDPVTLEAEIAADRGTAEGLLSRVEGLDTPDELAAAQSDLVQAFELRRDALAGISESVPTALGDEGSEAVQQIAADMRALLASDVLYTRARSRMISVLEEEEIGGRVPRSQFLPDPPELWLDDLELASTLSTFAADAGGACRREIHGLELLSTSVRDTVLTAGTENAVGLGDQLAFEVEVQNGGDAEEQNVIVQYQLSGPGSQIEGQAVIDSIDPGGLETAELRLDDEPPTGVPLSLEVTALPVPCETIFDNNTLSYSLTFEQ